MALISIIVPVYNVEKYLEKCLDSILAQSYREIELILVNDGSTDRSGEICDQYGASDNRVRVIHQRNQGVADARNNGLAAVTGEYLTFVDSDDYIEADTITRLYDHLKEGQAQVSICGAWLVYENRVIKRQLDDVYLKMDTHEALAKMLDFGYYDLSLWAKLYKTSLFEGIRFPSGIVAEDMFVTPQVLARAKCVIYDSVPKYYYRQHRASITKGDSFGISYSKGIKACTDLVTAKYPDLKGKAQCMDLYVHLMIYTILLRSKDKHPRLDEVYWEILEKVSELDDPGLLRAIPQKSRLSLRLLLHSRNMHTMVYRGYWVFSMKLLGRRIAKK